MNDEIEPEPTTDAGIPETVREQWANTTTITGWGQLVADWLVGDEPHRPGHRDTGTPGSPSMQLRVILADYAQAGLIPDLYQSAQAGEPDRRRAYLTGYATDQIADRLKTALAGTDLIIWADRVQLLPDSGSWLSVSMVDGVTGAAIGDTPGSWDELMRVADDTGIAWGELQAMHYVFIVDPKWGCDDRLWLTVHQVLYPNDSERSARLAFAHATANAITAQTGQPVTESLAEAWQELDEQRKSSIKWDLQSTASKVGEATGTPGTIKDLCDLLGPDAPFQVPSISEILTNISAAQVEAEAAAPPDTRTPEQKLQDDLLTLMSAWSEDQHCAGWLVGLDQELRGRGGIWEILGRAIGWPIGYRAEGGWTTWDEAGNEDPNHD